jgi:hypothetical protein
MKIGTEKFDFKIRKLFCEFNTLAKIDKSAIKPILFSVSKLSPTVYPR